ncbi:hypothetical protein [Terrabacter sp. 2RAF25]|uniref:hypothetical protein n=1 Tax=Terrabacter sp. 2RAF25 TaxID=3232998 RepID=UPI003F959B44
MHEPFLAKGGPLDGQSFAIDKGHDEEIIHKEGSVRHVYRTHIRRAVDGRSPDLFWLLYVGPNPFD